ncbi:MAG: energy transducer TonB [Dialister sp.]|nr:energy transducer TonB [Dialister sp.]
MKKEIAALALTLAFLASGCGKNTPVPETAAPPVKPAQATADTVQDKAPSVPAVVLPKKEAARPAPQETAPQKEAEIPAPAEDSGISTITIKTPGTPEKLSFELPYDIDEDRRTVDMSAPDIIVGDSHYMTQINDWYMNFNDYRDKTVVIEGYFLSINDHYFVGRNGPTCPYCTGGYVDFEFTSDQDFSDYKPASTWIKVYGILRQGTVHLSPTLSAPFYHIEALRVEKMAQEGIGTIVD